MIVCADSTQLPFRNSFARLVYADPDQSSSKDQKFTIKWLEEASRVGLWDMWLLISTHYSVRYEIETIVRRTTAFKFVQEIIWYYDFGTYTKKMFVPSHNNILVYKRGNPNFYWLPVAIESQRMRANDKRADWRGRTPGTVWEEPRVPGNSKTRLYMDVLEGHTGRSCQPEAIIERIIKAYTTSGDFILDMFCGSGTVPEVCHRFGRHCFSVDIIRQRCLEARNRVMNEDERKFMEF